MFLKIIILVFFTLLCGCQNTYTPIKVNKPDFNNPTQVKGRITFEYDPFKKQTTFNSPNLGTDYDQLFIRGWLLDDKKPPTFQIYIADQYYGDWRYYHTSYDSNGEELKTLQISKDVNNCSNRVYGCSHTEHLSIPVSINYLKNNSGSGISIKIYGKAGNNIFNIPSGYIKGLLSAIEELPEHLNAELLSYKQALNAIEMSVGIESYDYKMIKGLYDSQLKKIEAIQK